MFHDDQNFNYNNANNYIDHLNKEPMLAPPTQDRVLKLSKETGYPIQQTNGQRKMGPPPDWSGPPPSKGCEVFVGSLPRDLYEDEIYPLFATIGKIYELRLMLDFSMFTRGFAFVMYTTPSDACKAVRTLNNHWITSSKKIGVVMSKDNCRLYIGKIPKDKSKEDILQEMRMYTDEVVNVIVKETVSSPENPCPDTNFAFVEYATHYAAAMARRTLVPSNIKLFGVDVTIDWAQREEEATDEAMSQVTNLYVRELHPDVSEDTLFDLFSFQNHFPVTKVKKIHDFAFVHYQNRAAADQAFQLICQDPYFGSRMSSDGRTRLEVKWARPQECSKNKNGRNLSRGGYFNQYQSRFGNDMYNNNQNHYNRNYSNSASSGYYQKYQEQGNRLYYQQENRGFNPERRSAVGCTANRRYNNSYSNQSSSGSNSYSSHSFVNNFQGSQNYPEMRSTSSFNSWNQNESNSFTQQRPVFDRQEPRRTPCQELAGGDGQHMMDLAEPFKSLRMYPMFCVPSPPPPTRTASPMISNSMHTGIRHPMASQSPLGAFGSLSFQGMQAEKKETFQFFER